MERDDVNRTEGEVRATGHDDAAPADEAPDASETTENLCPECGGSGRAHGEECPACGGSGRVSEPIGGG
jgi:DnaJ-class molecular chaperone